MIEGKLTLQAASSRDLWSIGYQTFLENLGEEALDKTKLVWHNNDEAIADAARQLAG